MWGNCAAGNKGFLFFSYLALWLSFRFLSLVDFSWNYLDFLDSFIKQPPSTCRLRADNTGLWAQNDRGDHRKCVLLRGLKLRLNGWDSTENRKRQERKLTGEKMQGAPIYLNGRSRFFIISKMQAKTSLNWTETNKCDIYSQYFKNFVEHQCFLRL